MKLKNNPEYKLYQLHESVFYSEIKGIKHLILGCGYDVFIPDINPNLIGVNRILDLDSIDWWIKEQFLILVRFNEGIESGFITNFESALD